MPVRRAAHRSLLAAALLAVMIGCARPAVAVAGAGHGGGAGALTRQYPLGKQKLCCRPGAPSRSGSSKSPASRSGSSAATGSGTRHSASRAWLPAALIVMVLIVVVLLIAVLIAARYRQVRSRPAAPEWRSDEPVAPPALTPPEHPRIVWSRSFPTSTTPPGLPETRGTRPQPRPRHRVPRWATALLWPIMRYSTPRGAYVLRLVGERRGPVLAVQPRRGDRSSNAA